MQKNNSKTNNQGLSIVEVLVAIGIMSIMMVGFTSMMFSQNKEVKAVGEILAIQDLQRTLATAISDPDLCNYMVGASVGASSGSAIVFDARQLPRKITMTSPIYSGIRLVSGSAPVLGPELVKIGETISPYSSSLKVEEISFEIQSGSADNYVGQWIVGFDKSLTVRAHKPAYATTLLKVDDSNLSSAIILGCNGVVDTKLSDKNCPAGQVLSGFTADGEINCYNPFVGGDCASGSIVVGVNSNGTVNCRSPLGTGGACAPGDYVSAISPSGVPTCETLAQTSSDCVGAFDTCSKTCGGGTQAFRILRPKVGAGADCSHADGFTQSCNTQRCVKTSPGSSVVCADHFVEYQFRKNGSRLELLQWGRGRDTGAIGWNCGGQGPRVVWSVGLVNTVAVPEVSLSGTASGGGCYTSSLTFSGYGVYRSNSTCPARGAQNINSSFTVTYTDD